jgi:sulfur-oxidizing protein SoxX
MRPSPSIITTATSIAALLGILALAPVAAVSAQEAEASAAAQGKQVAFDRRKGNCLACHAIEGGDLAGNIGPPLVAMKARFPDKARLRAQIWDSTKTNPNSIMPPFGRHQVLTEKEIDQIVEYMYTL